MIRKQSEMQNETCENMRGGTGTVTIQHFLRQMRSLPMRGCVRN